MNLNKKISKLVSLAAATVGLCFGAAAANAAFINGSISFADGFATVPTLVSTDTFFDIDSANTLAVSSNGDFAGLAPALVTNAGDIDTLAPGGQLYDIGGFSFDWGAIEGDMNTPLSCAAMLCTDTRNITISGMVSGAGFDPTAYVATWTSNGACAEDPMNPGTCLDPAAYAASWSSSVVALGIPPVDMPAPGPLALISIGLLGLAYQRRRKA